MSRALARRSIWAAAIIAVAGILIVFVGLPFFASTQIVRDRIAHQMTAWSGYRVSIDEAPEVHVWPTFRAVLKDVRLQDWDETNAQPALEAEEIEADLSALAALRGDVVFTRMRLVRPVAHIRNDIDVSQLPSPQSWGRLARSLQAAKSAIAASPDQPDLSTLPSDSLGEIEFVDARIMTTAGGHTFDIVSSLSGALVWPALNRQATLSARGIWKGETVSVQGNSAQPLLLLGGGNAPLALTIDASPARLSFQGNASLAGAGRVDGNFEITAPSLNRLAEWIHGTRLPGGRIGPLAISARLTGDANRLNLEATNLVVDTSTGRGLLEISFEQNRPGIIGTLAFDVLNLRALAHSLGPLETNGSTPQAGMPAISGFDFDLRFSATTATFGTITLNKVAAAVKATDQLSTFDISDASAFGGNFQIGIRSDRTGSQELTELRLNGTEIELGQLAHSFDRRNLIPQGKASLSAFLKGTGNSIDSLLASADGEVSVSFGPGELPGIDFKDLLAESSDNTFILLNEDSAGSIALDRADLKAIIRNGLAQVESTHVQAGEYTLSLKGLVPVAGRALALSAVLARDGEQPEELRFFVGGSWDAPFITAPARVRPDSSGQSE